MELAHKKLTITVEKQVYEGLHRLIGKGHISAFINRLARPHVVQSEIEKLYAEAAKDEKGEAEALEFSENTLTDFQDETW